MTTGAEAVAAAFAAAGVDVAFGLPGVHNLALWPACAAAGVRVVGTRHEQGAAYAADGYARVTGRVGVALTTTGPGAANTLGAVGEAWASHSPVVVLATDIPSTLRRPGVYRGVLHECADQAAMFVPVTKARLVVDDPDTLGASVQHAIGAALEPPAGPVYVGVPTDFLAAPATVVQPPPPRWKQTRADVGMVVELIAASQRPLLWIGRGTRNAAAEIDTLATRLGAPVIATFGARGVLPASHPLLVPAPPHEPPVTELVRRADLAVVIGSDLDYMTTMGWRLPLPERRVAINVDAADATKNYPMDAVVEVDARFAGLLAEQIAERAPWAGDLARLGKQIREEMRAEPSNRDAVEFLERTEVALGPDSVVFADMCLPGYWLSAYYPVERPRGMHYPMGWGTLGWAFPAAVGAAAALGSEHGPVVAFCGDGGLLFAAGEMAAVAQEALPLTVVVVDDGGYGMLRFGREGDPHNGSNLSTPEFCALGASFGFTTRHVDGFGPAYEEALAEAVALTEPSLLHVCTASLTPPRTTTPRWPLR